MTARDTDTPQQEFAKSVFVVLDDGFALAVVPADVVPASVDAPAFLEAAIGMAFEAVDLDPGVGVAFGAKMLGILVAHDRFRGRGIMTVHAAGQAVPAAAIAIDNGFIALVHQEVHVLTAHDLDRLDAADGRRRLRRRRNRDLAEAGGFRRTGDPGAAEQ